MLAIKPARGLQLNRTHPLARGLVGFWLANEGSGGKVFDLSGGNIGTFQGGVSWSAGKFGSALLIDGAEGSYIQVPDSPVFDSKRTMIIWFKPSGGYASGGGNQQLINHRTNAGVFEGQACLLRDSSGKIRFSDDPGAGGIITLDSIQSSWNDEYYMLAITADGARMTMYINGIYENSTVFTIAFTNANNPLHFGGNRAGSLTFNGLLDIPMIYNRALSASEIAYLFRKLFGMFERAAPPRYFSIPVAVAAVRGRSHVGFKPIEGADRLRGLGSSVLY